MAGGKQSKKASHQDERLVSHMAHIEHMAQGSSRVSKAAGSVGPKGTSMEQRSSVPTSRSTPASKNAPTTRRRSGGNGNQGTRKAAGPDRSNHAMPNPSASAGSTRDTRFIHWMRGTWNDMEPHHQKRFLGTILLLLSLLLFGALTIFRNVPIFSALRGFFVTFFGWSAYLLALGLIAFAVAHLIEGVRKARFVRWSFVIGLIILWLIVLLESRQILGYMRAGVLAELLFTPLQGWHSPLLVHVLLIGSFVLIAILTFRITFGHVLMVGRA